MSSEKLSAVVVGCGGMGRNQAKLLAAHDGYELRGVCDIRDQAARDVAQPLDVPAYTDFGEMLAAEKPDVVAVCTANDTHASLTIQAAQAGSRGVYCEKPMATNLGDARAMVDACRQAGTALVINHQRRVGADLVEARKLIEAGAIGQVTLIRAQCPGDVLSDGTHGIDAVQWLTGDATPAWLIGQVHRDIEAQREKNRKLGRDAEPGTRYGHVVETGGMAVWQVPEGPRVELFCGDLVEDARFYQDYEIIGTAGRLWRLGDKIQPNLFISDAAGGPLAIARGESDWFWQPLPVEPGQGGAWRAVELTTERVKDAKVTGYTLFHDTITTGADHPMSGERALKGFEIVMAVYESARLGEKVTFPLTQERFPLELMVESRAM